MVSPSSDTTVARALGLESGSEGIGGGKKAAATRAAWPESYAEYQRTRLRIAYDR